MYFTDCELIIPFGTISENNLSVYPNPFSDQISVSLHFFGKENGKGKVVFKDIYGSEILSKNISIQKGINEWAFHGLKNAHSSIIILEVVLPKGEVLSKRLLLLKD